MGTITKDVFVSRARKMHGDKYDYSYSVYTSSTSKLVIGCSIHGPFQKIATRHLQGEGCPLCASKGRKISTLEHFIESAESVHGDRFDYSKSVYYGSRKPIIVTCRQHGDFHPKACSHLEGKDCPRCARERVGDKNRMTAEQFMERALKRHGNRYDYSSTKYLSYHEPVEVTCKNHGPFTQSAKNHLNAGGCPKCGQESSSSSRCYSREEFIVLANKMHGDAYDYSLVDYKGIKERVLIICRKHGGFYQEANNHAQGEGCPSCTHQYSLPHKNVEEFLTSLGVEYKSNDRSSIPPFELDVYVPSHKLAIEFNGKYWHSMNKAGSPEEKRRHEAKFLRCLESGIRLFQIEEQEWEGNSKSIWMSILASKLGKHQRRFLARKTVVRQVPREACVPFLDDNHLQGSTLAIRWGFGMFHQDELVGIATFSRYQKSFISLTRMAFKKGVTIVGGASKLFRNAIKSLPEQNIITFSDNRYSIGDVYLTLGFSLSAKLPPSYKWLFRNKVWNKRLLRHKYLPHILGNDYNPNLTEHENLYAAGARCLYDAGYRKWVFLKNSSKNSVI